MKIIPLALDFLLAGGLMTAYYGLLMPRFSRVSTKLTAGHALASHHGWSAVNDFFKLGLSGVSQFLFLLVLATATGVNPLSSLGFDPALILLGLFLGVGQMGFASFMAHLASRLAVVVAPEGGPREVSDWQVLARGGWMREYLNTLKVAPFPVLILFVVTYVTVEEMIFRSVLVNFFLPFGAWAAVLMSTLLFVGAQIFHTPGWRTAMFPVVGALVVGLIQSWLLVVTGDVTPLIVAHLAFFLVAII